MISAGSAEKFVIYSNLLINGLGRYLLYNGAKNHDVLLCASEEDPISFDGDHRRTVCERLQAQGLTGFGSLNIICISASGESRFAVATWEVAVGQNHTHGYLNISENKAYGGGRPRRKLDR